MVGINPNTRNTDPIMRVALVLWSTRTCFAQPSARRMIEFPTNHGNYNPERRTRHRPSERGGCQVAVPDMPEEKKVIGYQRMNEREKQLFEEYGRVRTFIDVSKEHRHRKKNTMNY